MKQLIEKLPRFVNNSSNQDSGHWDILLSIEQSGLGNANRKVHGQCDVLCLCRYQELLSEKKGVFEERPRERLSAPLSEMLWDGITNAIMITEECMCLILYLELEGAMRSYHDKKSSQKCVRDGSFISLYISGFVLH